MRYRRLRTTHTNLEDWRVEQTQNLLAPSHPLGATAEPMSEEKVTKDNDTHRQAREPRACSGRCLWDHKVGLG